MLQCKTLKAYFVRPKLWRKAGRVSISFILMTLLVFTDLSAVLISGLPFTIPGVEKLGVEKAEAAGTPAIKVESFDQNVTTDGSTIKLSNDVGTTSSAFIRMLTGTRKTSAGPTGTTGNTPPSVGTVGLVLTDTATVTVERVSSTEVKVMGEVWRYEGGVGSGNEFIVRDRVEVSLTGSSQSTAISGIVDVDKVVPFVTGYTVNTASVSNWEEATIAAHMDDSGNLVVSRNNSGTAATVYVDVVEFTGDEWTVCHGYSNAHDTAEQTITLNTDSDGQGGSTCDVTDWDTATIIEATMEGDSNETGLSDTLALVRPGGTTDTVVFDLQQAGNARNDGEAWIHVLQNDGLVVNRNSNTNLSEGNGAYGTATWPAGATTTADLETLSLEWFTDTTGVGTAHMRGGLHARITDASGTIQHWIHRSGNTVGVEYGVVELASLEAITEDTIVTATGTQAIEADVSTVGHYVGGAFSIVENNTSRNVTNITITESGTVDGANGLTNIELWYDLSTSSPYTCASESFNGDEAQFGSTDTNGFSGANGVSSFTDTESISPTRSMCVYVVLDVIDGANDNETIEISIDDPSSDLVTTGGGSVSPSVPVGIDGSTTLRNAELTQTHFRWLTDDGVEGSATAIEAEDTVTGGFANGTTRRLRLQVNAAGSTSSIPTTFRLEYATKTAATCGELSSWATVGSTGADWNMSASAFITEGNDATDIGTGSGGLTNPIGQSLLATNGGLRDVAAQTSALTLADDEFVEFEFAIEPSATAPQGNTYCFRVSDAGTELRNYDVYVEGTISADVDVAASGSHIATVSINSTDQYLGGAFVISRSGGNRAVTSITLTESGTVDGSADLSNITLYYDVDTTAPRDCVSESYAITDSTFGTADVDGFSAANGSSTFTGSETVGTNRTMCVYAVVDVDATASDGDTIEVSIANPSTDVIVTTSSVAPSSSVGPTSSTTIAGPLRTQTHFHWRNDDGSETGATSASGGFEDINITDVPLESTRRVRIQVSNASTVTSPATTYTLEYATKITTCDAVASWTDVGDSGGAWDMSLSSNISDGNTTDIPEGDGGMTNANNDFVGTSSLRETSSDSGSIVLSTTEFTELEYSIAATIDAGYGTTYCFRISNNGTDLEIYDIYPALTTIERQDFLIQRGIAEFTGVTTTLTAGVDYTAPASTSTSFVRITTTQLTGAGGTTGGGTRAPAIVTAYIGDQSDLTTSFTIERPNGTSDTRVDWELVEYIGISGGDNEIIVRDVDEIDYSGSDLTVSGTAVSAVSDDSDVVVFITGQYNNSGSAGRYDNGLSTSEWSSGTAQPIFTRASSTDDAAGVSYAVVEFTGANWKIQRAEHTYDAAGAVETEDITVVQSLSSTFVHAQKRVPPVNANNPNTLGLDEAGHQVWLSSLGAVSFSLRSGATSPTEHVSVAWIIENTQTGDGATQIYRSNGTIASGGAEPESNSVPIGGTVRVSSASLFVTNDSSGSGTAFPRTIMGAIIASSTHYELWNSDTGQNQSYRTEVIEWPVAETSIRQNYYRWYVDNDALDPTDPWPVGVNDLGENAELTGADDPLGEGERIRLRTSLFINNASLPADIATFKLQYGQQETTCSAVSIWNDVGAPGSGEIWRGYDGSVVDGTNLATSSPAAGTLNLSVSDVAGTYEEQNDTATNPFSVDIGEDIEYDWLLEHNGAAQRTTYCFRMINGDDTELNGYINYPSLRTTGYTPVIADWRWYDDVGNVTPSSALAGVNVAPIDVAVDDTLKLRVIVAEAESAPGADIKFALQYSEYADFHDGGITLTSTTTCTASTTWCYYDGGGVDSDVIPSAVLTNTDSCVAGVGNGCGTHNEAATTSSSLAHAASAQTEFEFTLTPRYTRTNAVYYFRLVDTAADEALSASSSFPSIVTEGPQLVFTISGVDSGTTVSGVVTDATTTPTAIDFNSVVLNTDISAAQQLTVDTNALEGYKVLQYVSQQPTNGIGEELQPITSTNASPASWASTCLSSTPSCVGYHTTDATLSGNSSRFAPLDSYAALHTTAEEVMFSSVAAVDSNEVLYRMRVTELQAAGDYETTVTYIAIPVF